MACKYLKNKDVILFALNSWDIEIGTNIKKYASVLAEHGNRVLFVDRAFDRASLLRKKNASHSKGKPLSDSNKPQGNLRVVAPNIWVLSPSVVIESINRLPWPWMYDRLNWINTKKLAKEINKTADSLGFGKRLLFIDNDFLRGFYLPELLENITYTIFYIRDFLRSQDYFKRHGKRLEPKMIAKADITIANSTYLADYARNYNCNSHFVGQGVDLTIFRQEHYPEPADLINIPHPRIGYVGAILATRLDMGIIWEIASTCPEWNIILVGPEDKEFAKSDLHGLSNVHFLGRKNVAELPPYIQWFDVCINPQAVNEMTIGNYPLKIDEYLAMGKPVVATGTNAMQIFKEYVYLCKSPSEYAPNINRALAEKNDSSLAAKRISFAKSHNWDACLENLDSILVKASGT